MGDTNAKFQMDDFSSNMFSRDKYIQKLTRNHYLIPITGSNICTGSRYSFVPGCNGNPSLIDHVLCDENTVSCIKTCHIEQDGPLNLSRHLPIYVCLEINDTFPNMKASPFVKQSFNRSSTAQAENYLNELKQVFVKLNKAREGQGCN